MGNLAIAGILAIMQVLMWKQVRTSEHDASFLENAISRCSL
jgi:hypothetical protein